MGKVLDELINVDNVITKYIASKDIINRQLMSAGIINILRNYVENIGLFVYCQDNNIELDSNWENLNNLGVPYIYKEGKLKFLANFHDCLAISVSHYTPSLDDSERLMLKYFDYLIKIKEFFLNKYNRLVLENLCEFPLSVNNQFTQYYEKVLQAFELPHNKSAKSLYYILKKKPVFINKKIIYEYTITHADDFSSKTDDMIAFSKLDIDTDYSVDLGIYRTTIDEFERNVPINIIDSFYISIRPCELRNFARIFDKEININAKHMEYVGLMKFLNSTHFSLCDLLKFDDKTYEYFKEQICQKAIVTRFMDLMTTIREKGEFKGKNIVLYLLHKMNNLVLLDQFPYEYPISSDVQLDVGCLPFEELPFSSSLKNHNPVIFDIVYSIGLKNHECELLARKIYANTEKEGKLYTSDKDFIGESIDCSIAEYNSKIYQKHKLTRSLVHEKGQIYINGYEIDCATIIKKLIDLSSHGVAGYSNFIDSWLINSSYIIDSDEKKEVVKNIFVNSRVGMIYGSAGTGKTTLINHLSNAFANMTKVYLANTNTAVDNLKSKVKTSNSSFKTVHSFLSKKEKNREMDILFIDECSTVSNEDMVKLLNKAIFKALVLVGDIYQIESIRFGNWFKMIRSFIPKGSVYELTNPYRTQNNKLLNLWDSVRNFKIDIAEKLQKGNFNKNLSDLNFFEKKYDDEMILCLNYDGLYGINNINKLLQIDNKNPEHYYKNLIYKVDDPILFKDNTLYSNVLHNNLKGKIVSIEEDNLGITFHLKVNKVITEFDITNEPIRIVSHCENKTIIEITVQKFFSKNEEEMTALSVVPFQTAYAISIHKSQGLEYDSVKVIITDDVEELITHNIFYTAITRARENLEIYWHPETEKKVLSSFIKEEDNKDTCIIANKFGFRKNK